MSDMSTWTINGEPQTWQQMYEREHAARMEADRWRVLVSDLDRCEHGRHEGDDCSSCGGPSVGNPLLPVGTVLGRSLSGHPYVVPPRVEKHRIDAWGQP